MEPGPESATYAKYNDAIGSDKSDDMSWEIFFSFPKIGLRSSKMPDDPLKKA